PGTESWAGRFDLRLCYEGEHEGLAGVCVASECDHRWRAGGGAGRLPDRRDLLRLARAARSSPIRCWGGRPAAGGGGGVGVEGPPSGGRPWRGVGGGPVLLGVGIRG